MFSICVHWDRIVASLIVILGVVWLIGGAVCWEGLDRRNPRLWMKIWAYSLPTVLILTLTTLIFLSLFTCAFD